MLLLDAAGRRRSPATLPGYHAGRPPRIKRRQYPADPPTVEEIVAVMRHAGEDRHGWRLRAVIVVLWRAGLRVQQALALTERELDPRHANLGTTSVYLQGIDTDEIIATGHPRRAPMRASRVGRVQQSSECAGRGVEQRAKVRRRRRGAAR